MYAIEVLPEKLQAKSAHNRYIILDSTHALLAIEALAAANWAVCGWEGRVLVANDPRTLHHLRYETGNNDLLWRFQAPWRTDESWEAYVQRATAESALTVQQTQALLDQLPNRAVYFKLEALAPHSYLEKINAILAQNFAEKNHLIVEATNQAVPLVAVTLRQATRSFSAGQLVYVYNVYWGENMHARVVGRFRRKNRWIKGICPVASLDNFRPKMVYRPDVIEKLNSEMVESHIFPRFFAMPAVGEPAE